MSKKKKSIDQWMRSLHRDLGYFTIGLTLIYALSGVVLSVRGLGWFKQELNNQIIMKTQIQNKEFNKAFIDTVKKGNLPIIFPEDSYKYLNRLHLKIVKEDNNIIHFNAWKSLNIFYNTQSGTTNISFKKYPQAIEIFLDAHKASHESAWFYLAMFYSVVLSFFAISAMFMVRGKYGFKRRGVYLMFAGIIVVVGFLVIS